MLTNSIQQNKENLVIRIFQQYRYCIIILLKSSYLNMVLKARINFQQFFASFFGRNHCQPLTSGIKLFVEIHIDHLGIWSAFWHFFLDCLKMPCHYSWIHKFSITTWKIKLKNKKIIKLITKIKLKCWVVIMELKNATCSVVTTKI